MNRFYSRIFMAVATFFISIAAFAIVPPVGEDMPEDGAIYLLQNVNVRSGWLGHTSWDNALCYDFGSSENFVKIKAVKNDNDTWSFIEKDVDEFGNEQDVEGGPKYLVLPSGSVNLNCRTLAEANISDAPQFNVIPVSKGTVRITIGTSNWYDAIGFDILMNAANNYIICTFPGQSVYENADIYRGFITDPETGERLMDDEGNYFLTDSTTCYWNLVRYDNYKDYMGKASAYTTILNYERDFVNSTEIDPEYTPGFAATLEAVSAIYDSEDYECELDNPTIINTIAARVNLYNIILSAIKANVDDNALLNSAIESAKKSFAESNDLASLESAYNALHAALSSYQEGTGDLTALIQNPSFEDLSSQNGAQTSGVEGAPTGWNCYINGTQVVTADDVKNAGVTAWHGINNDSEGEAKDGSYAFGLWTGSVPKYEISQKIEGLENGTYIVSAGLMAGANGNGSRMTTQRIFANLNSTYFGIQEDYNESELDKSEVYDFQGNDQFFTTDRYLFPMQVRAYVYDGTLTFGLRTDGNIAATYRDSNNSAGGDGWFKVDNFHLQYLGNIPEDAYNIFQHFYASLQSTYELTGVINADLRQSLEEKMDAYNNITPESDVETINTAIFEVRDLVTVLSDNMKAYDKLLSAIDQAWEYLDLYQDYPGAPEYGDVIFEVDNNYIDGVYTTEQCDEAIQQLADALQDCIDSNVVEPGMDITNRLHNPSFEDYSSQGSNDNSGGVEAAPNGWNLVINGVQCVTQAEVSAQTHNWCAINRGDALDGVLDEEGNEWYNQYTDGEHLWGIWSGEIPVLELYQMVNLPAGTYKLSADIIVQNDWAGYNLSTQRLFAGDFITMYGSEDDYEYYLPEDAQAAKQHDLWNGDDKEVKYLTFSGNYRDVNYSYSSLPHTTTVIFGTDGTEPVKIGIRTDRIDPATGENRAQASFGWLKVDNFRLECISFDLPDRIEAISNQQPSASDQMFNLAGQKVSDGFRGIVIINGQKQLRK